MLKDRPERESNVIYQRLRGGDDVHTLLSLIKGGDLVAEFRNSTLMKTSQSPETEQARPQVDQPNLHPRLAPSNSLVPSFASRGESTLSEKEEEQAEQEEPEEEQEEEEEEDEGEEEEQEEEGEAVAARRLTNPSGCLGPYQHQSPE